MLKLISTLLVAALAAGGFASGASAQGLFAPVIDVNEDSITNYEIGQRAQMLRLLRAPGDPDTAARTQLIEDRLKLQAAERAGTVPDEAEILEGMAEFAGRANLTREEFVEALAAGGVEETTFRAFVESGLAWRTLVNQRFGPRARVSEAEIDRALERRGAGGGSGVRVLISEIIMPAPPQNAETVAARAAEIATITSEAEFSRAARAFSATPTRGQGGRLPWQNLSELPPVLQPLILALAPGEVTEPLNIPNAVALFQLRAIEETPFVPPTYSAIEYAAYYMPGGRSEATLAKAGEIASRVDVCDDLYGIAKGQPAEVLERGSRAPGDLPNDIAIELSKLDPGEVSTTLTRANGETLVFLMLCGRSVALPEPEVPVTPEPPAEDGEALATVDTEAERRQSVALGLQNRRVQSLADNFLQQLQAEARIIER
ncbi:peptidylprolyl isomerase [Roseobacteraceae bacterium S113]